MPHPSRNSQLARRSDNSLKKNMEVASPPSRQNSPTDNVRSCSSPFSDVLVWDEIEERKRRMNKRELFDIIGKPDLEEDSGRWPLPCNMLRNHRS